MQIDIQRLRNLTTGILHTEIGHVYEDIESITGVEGVMTHQLPNAMRAIEPWLREQLPNTRFWDGQFDVTHTGVMELSQMNDRERSEMFERFGALPSLLNGKEVILVATDSQT